VEECKALKFKNEERDKEWKAETEKKWMMSGKMQTEGRWKLRISCEWHNWQMIWYQNEKKKDSKVRRQLNKLWTDKAEERMKEWLNSHLLWRKTD
jgi:hypothetical protein